MELSKDESVQKNVAQRDGEVAASSNLVLEAVQKDVATQEGEVVTEETGVVTQDEGTVTTSVHVTSNSRIKCRCGCVPDIMSLFEMAELRAKKRAEKIRNNAKTA